MEAGALQNEFRKTYKNIHDLSAEANISLWSFGLALD
jgi:hypothetical protein